MVVGELGAQEPKQERQDEGDRGAGANRNRCGKGLIIKGVAALYTRCPIARTQASPHFLRSHLRPGLIVLDIGANVGDVAAVLAECVTPPGGSSPFEASPDNAERLRGAVPPDAAGRDSARRGHRSAGDVDAAPGCEELEAAFAVRSGGQRAG